MNKSDFISDAVALDLGKSGVKVAETLEIEVDGEWWNLINLSEERTHAVYDKRILNQPEITEDNISVVPISENKSLTVGVDGYSYTEKSSAIGVNFAITSEGQRIAFENLTGEGLSVAAVSYLRYHNITNDTYQTVNGGYTYSWKKNLGCWFDSVNQVIIWAAYFSSQFHFMYANLDGTQKTKFIIVRSLTPHVYDIKTFPEVTSGAVYSLFWANTSNPPQIRKTLPVAGQFTTAQPLSVVDSTQTGTIVLSSVVNASPEHKLCLFYSRKYESVGVAWYNTALDAVQFVLEKDSWESAYGLPQIREGQDKLLGASNLVLDNEGELLVTNWEAGKSGNLTLPSGYSFPANFVLIGGAKVNGRMAKIWGYVGTNLYGYTLNYDTLELQYDGVVCSTWGLGITTWHWAQADPLVLEETETRLLVLFRNDDPALVLFDKTTNQALWYWYEWENSIYFPVTYRYYIGSGYIQRFYNDRNVHVFGDRFVFMAYQTATTNYGVYIDSYFEMYNVPLSDLIGCADITAVNSLLVSSGRTIKTFSSMSPVTGSSLWSTIQDNEQYVAVPTNPEYKLMLAEDPDYYYLYMAKLYINFSTNAGGMNRNNLLDTANERQEQNRAVIYIDKTTLTPVAYYIGATDKQLSRSAVGAYGLSSESKHRYVSDVSQSNPNIDGWVRRFNGGQISFINPRNSLVDANTDLYYKATFYKIPQSSARACVLNKYGEALFYVIEDANLIAYGGYNPSTNNASGHTYKKTLPFNAKNLLIDESEDFGIVMGDVADGQIPYYCFAPKTGLKGKLKAVKLSDFSAYSLRLLDKDSGGYAYVDMKGSTGFAISMTGKLQLVETNTSLDYGVGGELGETVSPVVFIRKENTYIPYPFAREGIKVELTNISKTTKVTIPETHTDLIRTMIAGGTDFRGSRCILRRLFPDHTEEGSDIILLDGYIQDWSYSPDKKGILFTVSKTLIDVGATFPKRLMNMGCSHVFRGVRCGYLGADGICTKTKTDCTSKGEVSNFGGFPWVAARQRRIMWR